MLRNAARKKGLGPSVSSPDCPASGTTWQANRLVVQSDIVDGKLHDMPGNSIPLGLVAGGTQVGARRNKQTFSAGNHACTKTEDGASLASIQIRSHQKKTCIDHGNRSPIHVATKTKNAVNARIIVIITRSLIGDCWRRIRRL